MPFLGNDDMWGIIQSLYSARQERQSCISDAWNVGSSFFLHKTMLSISRVFLNISTFVFAHTRYSILRHPSYVGFYYWAVGTQLVLCNPISTILYGLAAWTFFRYRIAYEEETLMQLFPDGAYESYAARTYIGIPFIRVALRFDKRQ